MRWPVEDTEASAVYLAPTTRARAGPTGPWVFGVPVSIDVSVLADLRTHLGMVTPNPEPAAICTNEHGAVAGRNQNMDASLRP